MLNGYGNALCGDTYLIYQCYTKTSEYYIIWYYMQHVYME